MAVVICSNMHFQFIFSVILLAKVEELNGSYWHTARSTSVGESSRQLLQSWLGSLVVSSTYGGTAMFIGLLNKIITKKNVGFASRNGYVAIAVVT